MTAEHARRRGITLTALRNRTLRQAIHAAVPSVTADIVTANYTHANTYLGRCLQLEDIVN